LKAWQVGIGLAKGLVDVVCRVLAESFVASIRFTFRAMQSRNALHFALQPIGAHDDGPLAQITTDYVEARVRYHLGASGAIAPEPRSGGEASAACPAEP
jgi:hypothetical protein